MATLSLLCHGEPGAGKSWLGQTTPAPRLIADAEGGSRYSRKHGEKVTKIYWDPKTETLPEYDGTWETCIVTIRDFDSLRMMFTWLNENNHPFRSLVIDSLTEIQKRCKDAIGGGETFTERQWGVLLTSMENLVRSMRDLTFHPTCPLDVVLILALTGRKGSDVKSRPAIQGSLGVSLPGYVDVEGYLGAYPDDDGEIIRKLLIQPHELFEAKDRTYILTEKYGSVVIDPDIEEMLETLIEEEGE